jgi:hypothetical protein
VYDWLLFLHVLAAMALFATVVIFSAFALGATTDARLLTIGNALWGVGGLGTLILGVWLAIYVDGYEVWDGWIILAILLWAIATGLGQRAQVLYAPTEGTPPGQIGGGGSKATLMHWLRSVLVLALLVVMIYKPGA